MHELSSCGAWAYLLHGMWDLSFLMRDWTLVPCIARRILNPWVTREVLILFLTSFQDSSLAELTKVRYQGINIWDFSHSQSCENPGLGLEHLHSPDGVGFLKFCTLSSSLPSS